jgi:hypothetical protein
MGKAATKAARFDPHAEIEKNQKRLRENIEQSKLLLEKTRQLLVKAKTLFRT